jgi:acetyltransferase-like isoleucine patch superfamily enzyme
MINRIINYFKKTLMSPEKYARSIGVVLGNNNLIGKDHWSTEPYLITIGNNTQITVGVKFHTHGAAQVLRNKYPDFDVFGKIIIEDWVYIGSGSQIMPGVIIKEGSIIAAGSVITKKCSS